MQAWMAWFGEMGAAVVDGGAPVAASKTLSSSGITDGGGANPAGGYTLVEAADMDAALTLAKGCPALGDGGTVEVAECIQM
jgi:hypothetical protein